MQLPFCSAVFLAVTSLALASSDITHNGVNTGSIDPIALSKDENIDQSSKWNWPTPHSPVASQPEGRNVDPQKRESQPRQRIIRRRRRIHP
ncbi:hypothetical protein BDZ97DRAFT_1842905 [Flammula alnicola]|nr:hypothetical protein BDZ97DRAFT_1842905 [Flammula alnicola]